MPDVGVEKGQEGKSVLAPTHAPLEQKLGQNFRAFLFLCHAALPPWRTVVAQDIPLLLTLLP